MGNAEARRDHVLLFNPITNPPDFFIRTNNINLNHSENFKSNAIATHLASYNVRWFKYLDVLHNEDFIHEGPT